MDVSVIIPVYGVEKYISKCLYSLFNQSKTNGVEFILVNDCSKDKSITIAKDIISEYPNLDIKIIEHKVNEGLAISRQTGLCASKGEYILHIDSDDWCELNMIEEMYNKAKILDADIIVCDFYDYTEDKSIYHSQGDINSVSYEELFNTNRCRPNLWNRLIKRDLYIRNKLRWIAGADYGEDALMTMRLHFLTDKKFYFPKAYLHYRCNPQSICKNLSINRELQKTQNINAVYHFLLEKKMNDACYVLIERMVLEKCMLLREYNKIDRRLLSTIYPQAKYRILTLKKLSVANRLGVYLTSIGLISTSNFLWSILLHKNRLFKNISNN